MNGSKQGSDPLLSSGEYLSHLGFGAVFLNQLKRTRGNKNRAHGFRRVALSSLLFFFCYLQLLFDNTFHLGTGVMFPEFMLYNLEMENDERVVDIKVSGGKGSTGGVIPLPMFCSCAHPRGCCCRRGRCRLLVFFSRSAGYISCRVR